MGGTDITIILQLAGLGVLWLVAWAAMVWLLAFGVYFCLSLPLRRRERARFFLDLVETALRDGKPVEATLVSASESRDTVMGVRFYEVAALMERGARLGRALEQVPRMLPPQVTAMLQAGERIGDLRKVLPACRRLLDDARSRTRAAMNYVLVIQVYFIIPSVVIITSVIWVFNLPTLWNITEEMGSAPTPELFFLGRHRLLMLAVQMTMVLIVWFLVFLYLGGPRVAEWFEGWPGFLASRIQFALPWRRKRLQRDFSGMLSVLLDAGMPEPEALELAAGCTANAVFQWRAAEAVAGLKQGMKLTEAVRGLDDTGEFHWRLTNACHAQRGFLTAMAGWTQSLDARAFEQEQAAAQIFTTALVIFNGMIVGLYAVAVFRSIINIIGLADL